MYTIYTTPGTGGFTAEAMLEAGNASWLRVVFDTGKDEHKTAEYLAINPAGQVPALKLGNGEVMTESAAICLYLSDAHPETGLAPQVGDDARPAYLRWMTYMAATVYDADLRYYYSERYTTDAAGADAVKRRAIQQLDSAFAIVEARLTETSWMAGSKMSAADIYLAMLASWHPDVQALKSGCPKVAAVWNKVAAADFVQRANDFHKLW
jgi:glutathione S-transferase